jgi:hypothetical protein
VKQQRGRPAAGRTLGAQGSWLAGVMALGYQPARERSMPASDFYKNPEAIRRSDWHFTPEARKRRREKTM